MMCHGQVVANIKLGPQNDDDMFVLFCRGWPVTFLALDFRLTIFTQCKYAFL